MKVLCKQLSKIPDNFSTQSKLNLLRLALFFHIGSPRHFYFVHNRLWTSLRAASLEITGFKRPALQIMAMFIHRPQTLNFD